MTEIKQYRHVIINARVSDSMEDWLLEVAINNTVEKFFTWKKENGFEDLQFEVEHSWMPHDYKPNVIIVAASDDPTVISALKLQHPQPLNKLSLSINDSIQFV
jgi:hypothetical protein